MTNRLPYLDLARGIAALCVLAFHYSATLHALDPFWPALPLGDIGVRAFFVISGFVITGTAMRSTSRGAFAWARFVRLYPAFLACMVLTTLWLLALHLVPYQIGPADWALNLTMVPGWFGAKMADSVYWTLAYEIGFYATVCALLPWVQRGRVLWLCAASLPVLWWLPLVGWFLIGVVAHEANGAVVRGRKGARPLREAIPRQPSYWSARGRQACTWAGAVSYPLYLLHCKIGVSLIFILSPIGLLPAALLTTVAMLALATLINRLIEVPAQAAMKRWGKPMMSISPVAA